MVTGPPALNARGSQDVLAAILTQTRDCIAVIGLAGELLYMNRDGADVFAPPVAAPLLGRSWVELWPTEIRDRIAAAMEAARRGETDRFEACGIAEAGPARRWDVAVSPILSPAGAVTHILSILREVSDEQERRETAEREAARAGDLAREMRHRLKNQLAVVGAVANLLARHTPDARALARKLDERLAALARAQDLLAVRRDEPATAQEAIAEVIAASGAGERVRVSSIPHSRLPDASVQQLALLLGELQTNALKYGALHFANGRIALTGRRESGVLTLRWREDCGAPVAPVETGSGGFQLISRLGSVGGAKASITWHDTGIDVEFHLRAQD